MAGRPRVVIIGAGFGGLSCARQLDKRGGGRFDVTVVDRNNFHTFQPLLYEVATAGLNSADVAYPVRGVLRHRRHTEFVWGEVTGVDWSRHELQLLEGRDDGRAGRTSALPFDYLVIAAGSTAHFFGVDGADSRSFPLYTLVDADKLRNHLLSRFEASAADPELVDDGAMTVTVVGGGPTGVEVAGALAELFAKVFPADYPQLDLTRARVVLVEQADAVLTPFTKMSRKHARETLESRGVEVLTDEGVARITDDRVVLRSGREIPSQTVVWAAGINASSLAARLGLPQGRGGRLVVGRDLAVAGQSNVWAIGDIADQAPDGESLPQLAQVAIQGGRHAADSILDAAEGRPQQPFHYHDKGIMATIGRRAAVVELPSGIKLSGTLAWFAWLGLHLVTLMGMRNRLSVLLNWGWNYFTWDRGPRLILESGRSKATAPDARDRAAATVDA